MASTQVVTWYHRGGILIPDSAGGAGAAALRSPRGPLRLGGPLALASGPAGLRRGQLRLRPPAAGPLVLLGSRPRGRPGGGHQSWPCSVLITGDVQTFDGWLFVVLQIAAVIMLAAPSAPLAIALDGSFSAAAT